MKYHFVWMLPAIMLAGHLPAVAETSLRLTKEQQIANFKRLMNHDIPAEAVEIGANYISERTGADYFEQNFKLSKQSSGREYISQKGRQEARTRMIQIIEQAKANGTFPRGMEEYQKMAKDALADMPKEHVYSLFYAYAPLQRLGVEKVHSSNKGFLLLTAVDGYENRVINADSFNFFLKDGEIIEPQVDIDTAMKTAQLHIQAHDARLAIPETYFRRYMLWPGVNVFSVGDRFKPVETWTWLFMYYQGHSQSKCYDSAEIYVNAVTGKVNEGKSEVVSCGPLKVIKKIDKSAKAL